MRARLSDFLREALRTTNAIAALLQQGTGGVDIAEARRLVTELAEAARRESFGAVASACDAMREVPRGGWHSFSRRTTALAAISATARASVERAIGAIDGDVPADLSVVHLAQLAVRPAPVVD